MSKKRPTPEPVQAPAVALSHWPSATRGWVLAGIILTTLLVYLPALQNGFTNWDDPEYVIKNPNIALSFENLPKLFTEKVVGNIHPLTMLSLGIDHAVGGVTNAFPYHLTSVLLHLLNVALVFLLIWKISGRKGRVAAMVALFFGIHPLHVESVAWISARKDVLYTAFFLGSLLAYIAWVERNKPIHYATALLLGMAAMLSKPAAVVLPVIMMLTDWYAQRGFNTKNLLEKLPFFAFALLTGWLTLQAQAEALHGDEYNTLERLTVGMYGFVIYITKAVWWGKLSAFYPYPQDKIDLPGYFYAYIPVFLGLAALAAWAWRRHRATFYALAFYAITIALVLKVVTVGAALTADRYTYLPYVGLFFGLAMAIDGLSPDSKWRTPAYGALAVWTLACLFTTRQQTSVWNSSLTLFNQAIENYPQANIPYLNRAYYYREKKQPELALKDYNTAIQTDPKFLLAVKGRGFVLYDMKKYPEVIQDFELLKASGETDPKVLLKLGGAYSNLGQFEQAIPAYNRALELDAQYFEAYNDRAGALFNLKNYDAAIADYTKALSLAAKDDGQIRLNRGVAYLVKGEYVTALQDFDQVIKIKPDIPEAYYYRSVALSKTGDRAAAKAAAEIARSKGYQLPAGYMERL